MMGKWKQTLLPPPPISSHHEGGAYFFSLSGQGDEKKESGFNDPEL